MESKADDTEIGLLETKIDYLLEENRRLERENRSLIRRYEAALMSMNRSKAYILTKENMFVSLEEAKVQEITRHKEEAEAANRAKSFFLAFMSHEIRTPLNAIIGFAEILLQRKLPLNIKEDMEKIHSSGTVLMGLINNILDFSKIESASMELAVIDYSVPSMINDILQMNNIRIGKKSISLELEADDTLPTKLCGDELRVKQILNNILSNAIKYTKEGKVILHISWKAEDKNTAVLIFRVEDTGQGIKKEDQEKLFSPYTQFNTRTNQNIEGTGLGLTITKNLVELMDGTISVESEYGKGTVFTVVIKQQIEDSTPCGRKTIENLKHFKLSETKDRRKRIVHKHMGDARILVVDDVAMNLDVVRGLIRPYGLTMDGVQSGPEAIDLIRSGTPHYDLIFMDHMMPGMDGMEASRIIRGMDSAYAKKVPIIALTANVVSGEMNMLMTNGIDDYLAKPIEIHKLNYILEKWVPREKQVKKMSPARDRAEESSAGVLSIPGVDTKKGLFNTGGTAKGYYAILGVFCSEMQENIPRIQDALETRDYQLYTTLVHALKGSARSIGAFKVGGMAADLEDAGRKQNLSRLEDKTGPLITELQELIAQITRSLKVKTPDPAALPAEFHYTPRFDVLKGALINNDYQIVNQELERLNKLPLDKADRELLDAVEKDILLFEYEKAVAHLS
ncbi:MAG: response regulator [Treponema sp.]|jgi:signal transduction histidine kinase/HPt (histidine-containing phosphotransfer) domain-containing protein/FixJ family two-component response regulator|nr:response regulator [Treponema sp.]